MNQTCVFLKLKVLLLLCVPITQHLQAQIPRASDFSNTIADATGSRLSKKTTYSPTERHYISPQKKATVLLDPPTITTTESTCQANGTISVSGNSTYEYILTGGNIPGQINKSGASFTVDKLPKGNYVLTAIDPNTSAQEDYAVVVPGNYEQNWIFKTDVVFSPCSGGVPTVKINNFQIVGATTAQQRPPYTFRISDKNGSLPANGLGSPAYASVTEFSIPYPSGVGGNYELQAVDDCGNYKTITVNIPASAPAPNVSSKFINFANCNGDAQYKISASGGTGPYIYTVKSGPDQVGTSQSGADATFTLTALSDYVFTVTDECGGSTEHRVSVKPYTAPNVACWSGYGKCDAGGGPGTGSIRINVDLNTVSKGPVTVSISSASSCSPPASQNYPLDGSVNSVLFDDLIRPCTYTVRVEDGCGKIFTKDINLAGPGPGVIQCYKDYLCPNDNSTNYRVKIGTYGLTYNATVPLVYEVIDSTTNTNIAGYPLSLNDYGEVYPELPKGKYYIKITDACGATCVDSVFSPEYRLPTMSIDVNNKCFGAGQANVIGVNNRGSFNGWGNYYAFGVESGPSDVGKSPESDSPLHTARFSNLVSGGTYTFSFNDGCKKITSTVTMPDYIQPTWEIGYGALCPPLATGDLEVVNLQPSTRVGDYKWRIISTDSDLYGSTAPYNGTLPYPTTADGLGQTDSLFANLPPKSDGSVATYNFIGTDGCKNSYQGSGKIGPLPEENILLNKTIVCSDGSSTLRVRPTVPVTGATYAYYRDGVKVGESKKLFTTITPAFPGNYTIKVIASKAPDSSCFKTGGPVLVNPAGQIVVTNLSYNACEGDPIDLTPSTTGSTAGTVTFYKDKALSIPVSDPTAATGGTKFYIKLVTSASPICTITDSVAVAYTKNCTPPVGTISGKLWKDTNNDGLENNGEVVFGGVKVELFTADANGIPTGAALQTITTLADGLYLFTNLPQGDYVVKIDKTTIMTGMEFGTKKDVGFDDTIDNDFDATSGLSDKIVLNPNNPATKDFPNVNGAIINSPCVLEVTSVTKGTCYNNGAGQMLYDLTVNISWANAPSGETITITSDAGGSVTIDPATVTSPQTVILTALPSNGLENVVTAAFLTTTTCIDTLKYTASNCPPPVGTISGKFWKDTNNDGLKNNSEVVFGGVKVGLFAADANGIPTGAALQTVTTLADGLYIFTNLPQGDYVVKIDKTTIMTGMEFGTKKDVGFDDTIDNDFDATSGLSDKIVLNPNNPATKDFPNVNGAIINSIPPCPKQICTSVKITKN